MFIFIKIKVVNKIIIIINDDKFQNKLNIYKIQLVNNE
jgi:hypothetical protein